MYKHVFGPVPSRRLGISLGVDLVVSKSCNLNCIFCECGATKKIQLKRQRFKDMNEILNEIQSVLKDIKPDYVTFSGSGEPTLSLDLGNISKAIKEDLKFKGKICLITNSLLLADKQVIKELEYIDLIIPTLNTLKQDIFEKIVRPDYRTSVDEIRKGFINLNDSNYKGKTVYNGEAFDKGQKIEFIIDVNSGEVFKIVPDYDDEYNPNYNLPITFEQASRIALDNSFNGKVKSIELKSIDKRPYYTVEVKEDKSEKEINIDANTGKVITIKEDM